MQAAIDRVMHTYGMLVNLTPAQEQIAREEVSSFLAGAKTDDETKLAVEAFVICGPPLSAVDKRICAPTVAAQLAPYR